MMAIRAWAAYNGVPFAIAEKRLDMGAWDNSQPLGAASSRENWQSMGLNAMLAVVTLVVFAAVTGPLATAAADVPVVKGELGPCSADFSVTDSANQPLYDAKIQVTVRYGFMGKRKSDLEIGTNSEGKARFEGLPSKVKKPLEFKTRHGQYTQTVMHNPAIDCQARFAVILGPP